MEVGRSRRDRRKLYVKPPISCHSSLCISWKTLWTLCSNIDTTADTKNSWMMAFYGILQIQPHFCYSQGSSTVFHQVLLTFCDKTGGWIILRSFFCAGMFLAFENFVRKLVKISTWQGGFLTSTIATTPPSFTLRMVAGSETKWSDRITKDNSMTLYYATFPAAIGNTAIIGWVR